MAFDPKDYEQSVYSGIVGKTIGVYFGRPFEGWWKDRIQQQFGTVNRYVHEDLGKPLVVPDDDLSGTFTFIRALEDSGSFADTTAEAFGEAWLDYIVPERTILWWGGVGVSTEHTAFAQLKKGIGAPRSGSIALNGQTVAEQIGAQIFIDACGLVAPGKPELAVKLAARAGSVSHDGEAVYAAQVVAAMVSAAFVEKRIERLLDLAVEFIPSSSTIAQMHRKVRGWAKEDRDWQKTYDRIFKEYGYFAYPSNCHVVPNHALMVMAWAYAPESFHRAQEIVATAGWDTDCNAGNVGCVMGVALGYPEINREYDFHGPFADRLVLPTADGAGHVTDCLEVARRIARLGRRVMGWPEPAAPKRGARFHFAMPGALHGFMAEEGRFETRGLLSVENVAAANGERAMRLGFRELTVGRSAIATTPVLAHPTAVHYHVMGSPTLYPGMTARFEVECERLAAASPTAPTTGPLASARAIIRSYDLNGEVITTRGSAAPLTPGTKSDLAIEVPKSVTGAVKELGIEVEGSARANGSLLVNAVRYSGSPRLQFPSALPFDKEGLLIGWVNDVDHFRNVLPYAKLGMQFFGRNEGRGHLVTGSGSWSEYVIDAELLVHHASRAGILFRFEGLRRYFALVRAGDRLQLIRRRFGEERVLHELPCAWEPGSVHALKLDVSAHRVAVSVDGAKTFENVDDGSNRGAVGFLVENGVAGFRNFAVAVTEGA